jgi:hypothetical protein
MRERLDLWLRGDGAAERLHGATGRRLHRGDPPPAAGDLHGAVNIPLSAKLATADGGSGRARSYFCPFVEIR